MREDELFAAYGSPRRVAIVDERTPPVAREVLAERDRSDFYRHIVQQPGPDGCHLWRGPKNLKGYGMWTDPATGERKLAHRLAWSFVHGPVPDGASVRHVRPCTSRACVRPDHLSAMDRDDRRRGPGTLTVGQVREREFRARLRDAVARSIRQEMSTDLSTVPQHEPQRERALIHASQGLMTVSLSVENDGEKDGSST